MYTVLSNSVLSFSFRKTGFDVEKVKWDVLKTSAKHTSWKLSRTWLFTKAIDGVGRY